ncbi:NAD(P)/FAD-dependent oxidoreductase [Actinomadura rudentiformis]|uniref:NAD(P)/FAD-dependent oxidoreductase n=1 Tax=Actinomadura rudentiformis TaxID=359158 RepID=UPI001CEF8049|nr:FAD-dependent oxidoreductase [Actinomadura rudentiformis]
MSGLSGDNQVGGHNGVPVVVIGGGAIGLCIAYHLHRQGVPVHVVDRGPVGGGSSRGNAGWVCLSHSAPVPAPGVTWHAARSIGRPDSPLYLRPQPTLAFLRWLVMFQRSCSRKSFDHGYAAVARFAQNTFERFTELTDDGVATTLTRPGLLHAFCSGEEARRVLETQRAMAGTGYEVPGEILNAAEMAELDPAVGGKVTAGYLVRGEGVIDPNAFVESLAERLRKEGVTISEHTAVRGFRRSGGRVVAVRTAEDDIRCSSVVVSAGVWSADLLRLLDVRLPLQAGKGYSFSVKLDPAPVHPMYLGDKHVAVSPIGGTTRIAGTMELSGNNRRLDWRRIVAIARASRDYLGQWYDSPDELMALIHDPWVGGRPMLPDGLPVLDRVATTRNAYVATGHGMLGITLAPVTGKAMADFITTDRRPADLEPFRSDRFADLTVHRRPATRESL